VYTPAGVASLKVRDVIRNEGVGTAEGSAIVMPLDAAQRLLNKPGQIKHVIVSNRGDAESGVQYSDEVVALVQPTVERLGLGLELTKQEDLGDADEVANAFAEFFVIFGVFSIVAGILLIFLIFVMLSAERRSEMGIARAIGAERSHLVRMFVFEGLTYDLFSAFVGTLLGVAVAYVMLYAMAAGFAEFDIDFKFDITPRSLIVSYTIGVVLTFLVVTVSAWRVSVLNVVNAIRNQPETKALGKGRGSLLGMVVLILALLLMFSGLSGKQAAPFNLGVSLAIVGFIPLVRRFGLNDRASYTVPGVLLVVWWLLPQSTMEWLLPDMAMDFSIFILSGLMVVTGATWVIMYNSDIVLNKTMAIFGRIRWLAPPLKTSIAYPLKNRFRVGMTLAMFTLVVFTLVVGSTTVTAFTNAFDDVETYGGSYDIHATSLRTNPVDDVDGGLRQAGLADKIEAVAALSVAVIDARQVDTTKDFEGYALRGLDGAFLNDNHYEFGAISHGYSTAEGVWAALESDPHLAVIDAIVVPHRDNFGISGALPEFSLEGFFLEDGAFEPVQVEMRDPRTGKTTTVTIIAVLKDVAPPFLMGISASQALLDAEFPDQAQPNAYLFRTPAGVDVTETAEAIEAAFFANGMEAEPLQDELSDLVGVNRTFNYIMQGFMGLGLVVGVAALGVISARAVVERRHEIGVMRAIGFEQGTVQISFLMESSFVAVVGIVCGTVLGLMLANNVITDAASQPSWENIKFTVPWLNLLLIFAVVYGAALLTSLVPARRASHIYPAEALRYQ
jgi:putative ABC transport system permease protein